MLVHGRKGYADVELGTRLTRDRETACDERFIRSDVAERPSPSDRFVARVATLEREGINKFVASVNELLQGIAGSQ